MPFTWSDDAWNDYVWWQSQDRKTLKRINLLLKDIQRNRYEGLGKPEPLEFERSGWWSRRIDQRKLFKNPISERWGKQICLN